MLLHREERRYHRKISILALTRLSGRSVTRLKFLNIYVDFLKGPGGCSYLVAMLWFPWTNAHQLFDEFA
jgi:hypothetical protein